MEKRGLRILSVSIIFLLIFNTVALAVEPIKKDESVYVTLTEEGKQKQVIVSDWLHSEKEGKKTIRDKSDLKDIVNLKGKEAPKVYKDKLVWDTDKKDIFYQGKTNKNIPLKIDIKYYLNGKLVKPSKIAGKSGDVKIKIKIRNKDKKTANVKGKKKYVYTPFTVATVINLPMDKFTRVKASSGKIVSDGNNQIITFVSFPGLAESLDIEKNVLDMSDELVIEAEADKFELGPIMITATPNLPDIEKLADAKNEEELQDGIAKLKNSTVKLSNATGKLKNGAKELNDGVKQVKDGSKKLAKGTEDLTGGAGELSGGAKNLSEGTKKYYENMTQFTKGINDVAKGMDTLSVKTSELATGLNDLSSATDKLENGQIQINQGIQGSIDAVEQLKKGKQKELELTNMLLNSVNTLEDGVSKLYNFPGLSSVADKIMAGLKKQEQGLNGIKLSSMQLLGGLDKLQEGLINLKKGSDTMTAGLDELQVGQQRAASGAIELAKGSNQLKDATGKLKGGSYGLQDGAVKLSEGAKRLEDGTIVLKQNTDKLMEGAGSLDEGVSRLSDGSSKLSDGSTKLDIEVQAIVPGSTKSQNIFEKADDIEDILATKNVLVDMSKNYGVFTDKEENMESTVKFVMKTDEIKAKEAKPKRGVNKNVKKQHIGFLSRLKRLFRI